MPIEAHTETVTLRTALRELVALSTMPATWLGREPHTIAAGLADVLVGCLHLDFAFVRLCDPKGSTAIEVTRGDAWRGFPKWLQTHGDGRGQFSWKEIVTDLGGGETCRGIVIPIGVNAAGGLVAVASIRADFPSEIDQLLLSVAANHAATAFQDSRLMCERRQAEEALRESEHRWRSLTEALPQLVWAAKPDGTSDYFSTQWTEYTGVPESELLGWRWIDALHPDDREPTRQFWADSVLCQRLYDVEYRVRRRDGAYGWFKTRALPIRDSEGKVVKWLGTCTDITDLRRAEEGLRQSEQELREARSELEMKVAQRTADLWRSEAHLAEAQKVSHTGSFGWSVSSGQIYWSEETFRIFEYDRANKPTVEFVLQRTHPADKPFVRETLDRAARDRKPFDFEHRLLMQDGTVKYVRVVGHPSAIEELGKFEFVGAVTDITESKRAEESLRRSESYLAEAQRLTKTGSWAWNVRTGALFWSQEILRIYDYDPAKMVPTWADFLWRVHPEDRPGIEQRKKMESTQKDWVVSESDFRIVLPDGRIKQLHSIAHPVMDESGEITEVVGTVMDVTERKLAEEERERLRQVQADLAHVTRVTTMGELTASLAHEIKQPISAAITDAKTCLRWLGRDDPDIAEACEAASRTVKDAMRAAEIISSISLLFKKGALQRELLDVNELIREMIVLLRSEASRYSISIHGDLADNLPKVMADRVQLQQVLMNLMLNGIDAMKDMGAGSELTINSQKSENGQLLISVGDTGMGLQQEQAEQIFDAFFTTKPQGTGMGLPISRSIIESHGGRLWAATHSSRGATFQFTLPSEGAAHQAA